MLPLSISRWELGRSVRYWHKFKGVYGSHCVGNKVVESKAAEFKSKAESRSY